MRKALTAVAATLTLTLTPGLIDQALAHGGAYRGPIGEVPPDSRDPSDPPPPPPGGGPSTPPGDGGDGPSTPPDDVGGGPTTPPDGDGPDSGPAPGPGPDTTGPTPGSSPGTKGGLGKRPGKQGPGFESWTFWWNYNKDEILQLQTALGRAERTTGSDRVFGTGATGGARAVITATDASIETRIVPALMELLSQDELNFDIQSAAALALAKIGHQPSVPILKDMALDAGTGKRRYHRIVVESAALAFGLLQQDTVEVREFLLQLAADADRDSSFVRPFAVVSLGLLGQGEHADTFDRDGVVSEALLELVRTKQSKADVKPAALLALGLLESEAVVPELLEMLETGRAGKRRSGELTDTELAHLVGALGRIGVPHVDVEHGDGRVVETLRRLIDDRKGDAPTNVRRSAAIALGQIAPQCEDDRQRRIIKSLKRTALDAGDSSLANFAMIAMGRIGGAEGASEDVRDEAVGTLRYLLEKASPATIKRPFAALGLGLVARGIRADGGVAPEEEITRHVRESFREARNPTERGGYAVALGLLRDTIAVPELIAVLDDDGATKKLRGYAAVALGMIGAPEGRDAVQRTLTDGADRELRVQTAVAAGLLGDGGVVGDLVEIMEQGEESQYVLGSVALALGKIGDERAITPLLDIATDAEQTYPDLTRALATVALGQIGDRRPVPVLSRVAKDVNYRAHVPALAELLTIL